MIVELRAQGTSPITVIQDDPDDEILYTTTKQAIRSRARRQTEEYVCKEVCCHRTDADFRCVSEWNRHAASPTHKSAVAIGNALRELVPPGKRLELEQDAVRKNICNAKECPLFGKWFPTPSRFFHHLTESSHLDGAYEDVGKALRQGFEKADCIFLCRKPECPKNGQLFWTAAPYKKHLNSKIHQEASGSEDQTPKVESAVQTPIKNFTTSFLSPTEPLNSVPESPSAGRGSRAKLDQIKLLLTAKKREEELQGRVRELEDTINQMKEEFGTRIKLLEEGVF